MQLFGTKGQKFCCCPGIKGQWCKLKIFPRDWLGQPIKIQNPGRDVGRDRVLIFCRATGWDRIFTARPVPEYLTRQRGKKCKKISIFEKQKQNCPGIFVAVLVSGQRDSGTRNFFCPGTKGWRNFSRDKGSMGRPVPWEP